MTSSNDPSLFTHTFFSPPDLFTLLGTRVPCNLRSLSWYRHEHLKIIHVRPLKSSEWTDDSPRIPSHPPPPSGEALGHSSLLTKTVLWTLSVDLPYRNCYSKFWEPGSLSPIKLLILTNIMKIRVLLLFPERTYFTRSIKFNTSFFESRSLSYTISPS